MKICNVKNISVLVWVLLLFGCTPQPKGVSPADMMGVPVASEEVYPASTVAHPAPKSTLVRGAIARLEVGEGDGKSNLYSHSYRVVNTLEEVKSLENTTTYVLLPDNISKSSNKESKKYRRYRQLLELIQELQKTDLSLPTDSVEAKSDNQFVLFSKENKEKPVTVVNYNYALAHKVLDFFKKNYSYRLFDKEGPYLVTVSKNVWRESSDFTFLYVNMSSFNNSALKEVLESYKERLITKGNDEITIFEKLHSTLLSFITNLNDDIHIFQSAFAGEL